MGWRILHSAFNEAAGKSISSGSVAVLLQRVPWLRALEGEIESFYLGSAERFFQQCDNAREIDLRELAESLYRLEKRQVPFADTSNKTDNITIQ